MKMRFERKRVQKIRRKRELVIKRRDRVENMGERKRK
jgi:hypothetical protein